MESQCNSPAGSVLQGERTDLREPEKFKVVLFNDDYTTKDFVVDVLRNIFHKNSEEAVLLMETVHKTGQAVVGVYAYDIALTRATMVVRLARRNSFPLRCEIREDRR